ncbi:FG-GAP repeat domain-containing protein [Nannocystis pusilla]|uniref:VCBS repeat-containing protein n=1 Tax=Nannocystis pusilla TaxID=889268 RepID=A0ABS7TT81_9BACT|nr:VCBS repeat-containing protein [Nannocystis pusilla]MBZ5711371.1 VCBS repeat-containing protein [Nannocystis pusilla]
MQARLRWMTAGLWVSACGPLPPESETAGEQTSTATSATTGDPTEPVTTGPTTSTSETTGTSGPPPECQSDADCGGFCEYCVEGECYDAIGCCGVVPNPQGELELRCQGYECYADDECDDGYFCEAEPGWCQLIDPIPVCERQPLMLSAIPLQGSPSAVALADLDGDAALDLVAVLPDTGQVEVMLGDGLGEFAPGQLIPTELGPGSQRLAIADFDGNGSPDLAITQHSPVGELSLVFGEDAVFAAPVKESIGTNPTHLWTGDFDGDGAPDLLTRSDDPSQPIALRLGDGMGGFGETLGAPALSGVTFAAAVGAVGGEATRADLVTAGAGEQQLGVFELVPGLGLEPVQQIGLTSDEPPTSLVVGEVDGDGAPDVVGHWAPGFDLLTIWSLAQASPTLRVEGPVQLGPVADVDGDGAGDLVTGSSAAMRVIFVAGGTCVQSHPLPGEAAPALLASGDVDGDGKADVLAGAADQPELTLLRSGP